MGEATEIEWTDHTFNPWHGCARVSPGCEHCYAETFSKRVGHGKRLPMIWGVNAERKFVGNDTWAKPFKWNAKAAKEGVRRRVFCASMADVFEDRADLVDSRRRLMNVIEGTPALDWLLLTKRPQNVLRLWRSAWGNDEWPANVWLGTTVEDQKRADERIPELLKIPARVRFLSCEPLLEEVKIRLSDYGSCFHEGYEGRDDEADHRQCVSHLDWVIVGGESGGGARPFDLAWARSLVNQCKAANVACFVKQLGARAVDSDGIAGSNAKGLVQLRDHKGGDWTEWTPDLRVREWPASVVPKLQLEPCNAPESVVAIRDVSPGDR
jgi:protein gp37